MRRAISPPSHAPRPVPFDVKFWYGAGQAAEGVKNAALSSLLLFYYNQVLGVDAALVGLALLIAIITDGVSDVVVGSISDNFKHRWGRRHPFMYAAAIPFGLAFWALFSPPALGPGGLFWWLLAFVILARNFMTLYAIPHYALGAELTSDHDERTVIVAYRAFFGFLGSASIFAVAAFVFRPANAAAFGQFDQSPYAILGLGFGIGIAVLILASAWGTHRIIPMLPAPAVMPRFTPLQIARDCLRAFRNRSFRIFSAGLFSYVIGLYLARALDLYLATYLWELARNEAFFVPLAGLIGGLVGVVAWVPASRRLGKRQAFIAGVSCYGIMLLLFPMLKIGGYWPSHDSPIYLATILASAFITSLIGAAPTVVSGAMVGDIADESDLRYGTRQEGMFFAAINTITKISGGLAAQIAGILVAAIGLSPTILKAGGSASPSDDLVIIGLGCACFLSVLGAGIYLLYPLDRERCAEIHSRLAQRNASC